MRRHLTSPRFSTALILATVLLIAVAILHFSNPAG